MPSNHNYVCFDCRTVVRRSKTAPVLPTCSRCGEQCSDLGYKSPLPPKEDADAWQRLYVAMRESERRRVELQAEARVVLIHDLERQIARLERLPEDADRARTIRGLRQQLTELQRGRG